MLREIASTRFCGEIRNFVKQLLDVRVQSPPLLAARCERRVVLANDRN
jgi:hypothetical protein